MHGIYSHVRVSWYSVGRKLLQKSSKFSSNPLQLLFYLLFFANYLKFRINERSTKSGFATAFRSDNVTTVDISTRLFLCQIELLFTSHCYRRSRTFIVVKIVTEVRHVFQALLHICVRHVRPLTHVTLVSDPSLKQFASFSIMYLVVLYTSFCVHTFSFVATTYLNSSPQGGDKHLENNDSISSGESAPS